MMDWQVHSLSGNGDVAMGPEMFMLIAVIIILLQLRTRRVRLWSLWIMPVILLSMTSAVIAVDYGGIGTALLSVAGFAVGCVIGVVIGSRIEVTTDERGRIVMKGTLVAVTIWILVLGLKYFGKGLVGDTGIVSLNDLTAMLLALTLGMMIARRAYLTIMYLRLKKQGKIDTTVAVETINRK
jgi:membrane protein CcdC involved in cytochrome C biogenesis